MPSFISVLHHLYSVLILNFEGYFEGISSSAIKAAKTWEEPFCKVRKDSLSTFIKISPEFSRKDKTRKG